MKKLIIISIFLLISVGWGQDCDENMYWTDCGLPFECNPTCPNPNPPPDCFSLCEIGCFCNEGYIFSDDSFNECILIENCPEQYLCDEGYVELWGECYTITFTTYLDLSEMGLSGEIPFEIGDLTNLTNLDLGGNQLSGEIPSEIGNLTNLTVLDFGGNQLSGEIPYEICNLTNLTELELGGNHLSGEIPSCIENLINLTFIHLEYNQFSGEIPSEIGNLTNLIWLNFVHNQLSGEIPSSICNIDMNWSNPDNFNIYENQLCPPYPECIESYVGNQDTSNCEEQSLCDEETEVELWGECYNIEETTILDPYWSSTSGQVIPPEIGQLTNLTGLHLIDNELTGEIPSEIGNLMNLLFLELDGNQLTGEIPSEIGNLTNLISLKLSGNTLTGEIPPEIGDLTNLHRLTLNDNQLTGEIPESICSLTNLINWSSSWSNLLWYSQSYIYNNQLCSPYPECFLNQEPFTDDNGNSIWDEGESFEDTNENGYYEEDYVGEQDTSNCEEECSDSIEGDLNYDGIVNVIDVVTLVTCILSDNRCDICFDISGDGFVDVLDIVDLVNIILDN